MPPTAPLSHRDSRGTPARERTALAIRLGRRPDDPQLWDRLFLAMARPIDRLARPYLGMIRRGADLDDLRQAGRLGVILAVALFDPSRRRSFGTYARWRIRHEIQRCAVDALAIRLPRRLWLALWVDDPDGLRLLSAARPTSAEAIADPEHDQAKAENDPGAELQARELVKLLDPRASEVIRRRYGFLGGPGESYRAIGRALGISHQAARMIDRDTIAKLRTIVAA